MLKRNSVVRSTAVFLLAIGGAASVQAATVTDFNFDSADNVIGQPLQTTTPGTDPQPQHIVYATGGFPDTDPYTGTDVVGDAGTMTKAAIMTTTQGGTASNFVDTQFIAPTKYAAVSFDLDVIATPTTGIPQSSTNAPNGQAWILQAFELSGGGGNRAFRFVAAPTTPTGGIFGLRNNIDGDIISLGSYTNGTTYHVEVDADFNSASVNAFINNTQVATNLPFVDAPDANDGLGELFIFQNDVEGQTNQVAFDNLVTSVPEPVSMMLFPVAGILLGRRRNKR